MCSSCTTGVDGVVNTGVQLLTVGGSATVQSGAAYKCDPCASAEVMLCMEDLEADVSCERDDATCVLDGENDRRIAR